MSFFDELLDNKAAQGLLNLGVSAATEYFGGNDPKVEKTGYQGGIPAYEVQRERVPNIYDPNRRPGSAGRRYFTDTQFIPKTTGPALPDATGLANINAQNVALANAMPGATTPAPVGVPSVAPAPIVTAPAPAPIVTAPAPAGLLSVAPAPVAPPVAPPMAPPVTPTGLPSVAPAPKFAPPAPINRGMPEAFRGRREGMLTALEEYINPSTGETWTAGNMGGETPEGWVAKRFLDQYGLEEAMNRAAESRAEAPPNQSPIYNAPAPLPVWGNDKEFGEKMFRERIPKAKAQFPNIPSEYFDSVEYRNHVLDPNLQMVSTVDMPTKYFGTGVGQAAAASDRAFEDWLARTGTNYTGPISEPINYLPYIRGDDKGLIYTEPERVPERGSEFWDQYFADEFAGTQRPLDVPWEQIPDFYNYGYAGDPFEYEGRKLWNQDYPGAARPAVIPQSGHRYAYGAEGGQYQVPIGLRAPAYFAEGGIANLNKGMYLGGPTDGMADVIPANIEGTQEARLSDGEFVMPADVVSHLGNGNSNAGAKTLYSMMDRIRKARTGTKSQGKEINPSKFLPV